MQTGSYAVTHLPIRELRLNLFFFSQINKNDFVNFDYIFGMDDHNIEDLNERAPKNATAKILLLGEFDPNGERIIRDPYYVS